MFFKRLNEENKRLKEEIQRLKEYCISPVEVSVFFEGKNIPVTDTYTTFNLNGEDVKVYLVDYKPVKIQGVDNPKRVFKFCEY